MRTAIILLAVLLVAGTAFAGKTGENAWQSSQSRLDCLTDGYTGYTAGSGGAVPDGDPNGATFGPLPTVATGAITDVILFVNINQTWIGDLRVWLLYDADCDGTPETQGEVLCRHTLDGCGPDGCCGCSGNLNGWYGFDDTAASIEDGCPVEFPPGCYGPDYDAVGLNVFDGLSTGGCFYLFVGDGAGGDPTTIVDWEVYVECGQSPVKDTSWGKVKAQYRN
jgi:hypothetical protein